MAGLGGTAAGLATLCGAAVATRGRLAPTTAALPLLLARSADADPGRGASSEGLALTSAWGAGGVMGGSLGEDSLEAGRARRPWNSGGCATTGAATAGAATAGAGGSRRMRLAGGVGCTPMLAGLSRRPWARALGARFLAVTETHAEDDGLDVGLVVTGAASALGFATEETVAGPAVICLRARGILKGGSKASPSPSKDESNTKRLAKALPSKGSSAARFALLGGCPQGMSKPKGM